MKKFIPNSPPNRLTSQYKLVVFFNENSPRDGTTEYSYDTYNDPLRGFNKLLNFALKVRENGQLKKAIIYNNQTGQPLREILP